MAFAVFDPKPKGNPKLPAGEVTIGKRGLCNFSLEDLSKAGIDDEATVLFDTETKQIALRRHHRGETPLQLAAVSGGSCRQISLAGVFKALGVEPEPGRRKTTVELGMIGFKVED